MRDVLPGGVGRIGGGSSVLAAAGTLALLALFVLSGGPPPLSIGSDDDQPAAERSYGALPMAFAPAPRGEGADFVAATDSGTVALAGSGATLSLGAGDRTETLDLGLIGASPQGPAALDRLPGVVNDLRGDDPSRWRTGVPTFERIRYPGVYPGVDVDWYGDGRRLEYDFRLAPGADPSSIAFRVGGADDLRIASNGDLVIGTGAASIHQRAPVAYQPGAGAEAREPVDSEFTLDGNVVGFRVGDYDPQRRLVIDPLVLVYATYLGGDGADQARGIAVDSSGAAYVVGETQSTDFDTVGPIEGDNPGNRDVFVSKLNPAGNALAYSTYLGGGGEDRGFGIAVDSSGAAYVTGLTASSDFNTVGPIEGDTPGNGDVFVSKLTPAGSALAYSTYIGGNGDDWGQAIGVDATGAAYVTGFTNSTDFNTVNQFETYNGGGGNDVFVSKLNPAGSALAYSTYLGGLTNNDFGQGIAVDSAGRAYVTGVTLSTDFDTLGQIEADGDGAIGDAFVSKLDPGQAGAASLIYSTYLGGSAEDVGNAIAVDSSGAAFVTGRTASANFNTVGPIEGDSPGQDVFVSKLNAAGSGLAYSTYVGGGADEQGKAIAVDSSGAAHVAGTTESGDFDTVDPIESYSGGEEGFVSSLTTAGSSLSFSTVLGGAADDEANGIAVDATGALYIAGHTDASDFATLNPIEGDSPGTTDAVIAKLAPPQEQPAAQGSCKGRTATITGTNGADTLNGTDGPDVIAAGAGDDVVKAAGANDVVCGQQGNDRLKGAGGKDRMGGGSGKDRLGGGKSRDRLGGGRGNDRLRGGPARDVLRGGPGKDRKIQ